MLPPAPFPETRRVCYPPPPMHAMATSLSNPADQEPPRGDSADLDVWRGIILTPDGDWR